MALVCTMFTVLTVCGVVEMGAAGPLVAAERSSEPEWVRVVRRGEVARVRGLIPARVPIDVRTSFGRTPLHVAAHHGRETVVDYLLEAGASVDRTDRARATPLMLAALHGHAALVRKLLRHGADPARRDHHGSPVLMYAAEGGDQSVVRTLIEHGASPEARVPSGHTSLMVAALHGHEGLVRLLLRRGVELYAKDRRNFTALTYALFSGHTELAHSLLDRSDEPARLATGPSLVLAVREGDQTMMERLLKLGVDPDEARLYGFTPLVEAVFQNRKKVVKRLLEHGADPNLRTGPPYRPGLTPLMLAATLGGRTSSRESIVEILLKHGARVDARDPVSGMTPLLYSMNALRARCRTIEVLLQAGADPGKETIYGYNALEIAYQSRMMSVVRCLEKHSKRLE